MKGNIGSLTVICGSMFSGKTEELIRLVRRGMHARKKVQVFKSSMDTRCETTVIRTHDGVTFTALTVPDARTLESLIEPDVQIVGIEEVQFFDDAVVSLCQRLADSGIEVIAAGLDQDFRGLPFTFMPQLMALADNVMKLHAICKVCGGEASRTQRLVDGRPAEWNEPTILVGAEESYEARCRKCHRVRNMPKAISSRPSTSRVKQNGTNDAESGHPSTVGSNSFGLNTIGLNTIGLNTIGSNSTRSNTKKRGTGTNGANGTAVKTVVKEVSKKNGHAHIGEELRGETLAVLMDDGTQLEMFAEEA